MPNKRSGSIALSLVERGWQAARELSLRDAEQGQATWHLVKGWLPVQVRQIIQPIKGIQVLGIPKPCFWPISWGVCAALQIFGKLRLVVVDNLRSEKRLRSWVWTHVSVVRADESWYDAQSFQSS